jgi:hypothetical protein
MDSSPTRAKIGFMYVKKIRLLYVIGSEKVYQILRNDKKDKRHHSVLLRIHHIILLSVILSFCLS